jgi:hypothetical protein
MGTLELAVVGLAGSGIGTALGIPMVWPLRRRGIDVRLMGGWLLALSMLVALISARVIGLLPAVPGVDHAVNLVGLTAYPLLYLYVREQTGRGVRSRDGWWLWTPAAIYALALVARSALGVSTRVPFQWMLPVVLAFTVICVVAVVRRSGDRPTGVVPPEALVGFLVLMNVAQVVRMVFGDVALVPAVVPMVATAGFVALVGLVVWRAVDARPASDTVVAPTRSRVWTRKPRWRCWRGSITRWPIGASSPIRDSRLAAWRRPWTPRLIWCPRCSIGTAA